MTKKRKEKTPQPPTGATTRATPPGNLTPTQLLGLTVLAIFVGEA